jgi:hypothetical protein
MPFGAGATLVSAAMALNTVKTVSATRPILAEWFIPVLLLYKRMVVCSMKCGREEQAAITADRSLK